MTNLAFENRIWDRAETHAARRNSAPCSCSACAARSRASPTCPSTSTPSPASGVTPRRHPLPRRPPPPAVHHQGRPPPALPAGLRSPCRASRSPASTAPPAPPASPRSSPTRRRTCELWAGLCARFLVAGGLRPEHLVHIAFGYGLFTGGFGLHYGVERVGAAVVPAAGGNTPRQIMLIQDLSPTCWSARPATPCTSPRSPASKASTRAAWA